MGDYKEKIMQLVEKINDDKILRYIYIILDDIVKGEKKNEGYTDRHDYRRIPPCGNKPNERAV